MNKLVRKEMNKLVRKEKGINLKLFMLNQISESSLVLSPAPDMISTLQ